jgi:hypothetical protein
MQIKFINTIDIYDNFLTDIELINQLKIESKIDTTIKGQDIFNFTLSQQKFYNLVNTFIVNYCNENNVDYNNLELSNFQKGNLQKYDKSKVTNHLYEPHHDMVESSYITAIYYIHSDFNKEKWVGGELTIYKNLTFAEYPHNAVNILPVSNRLIIFPGFLVHRVKPYFGENPRTSLVLGWKVKDQSQEQPIIV